MDITLNGETHSVMEWCKICDRPYRAVLTRLNSGMPIGEALQKSTRRYAKPPEPRDLSALHPNAKVDRVRVGALRSAMKTSLDIEAFLRQFSDDAKEDAVLTQWCIVSSFAISKLRSNIAKRLHIDENAEAEDDGDEI